MEKPSPEQMERMFEAETVPLPDPALSVDPGAGPLPLLVREAILWLRRNGVSECELPGIGKFTLRPQPADKPIAEKLAEQVATKKTVIGGFDPSIIFAASPNPEPVPE